MTKTISLKIPLGFKVIEKTENMKVRRAEEFLAGRRHRRYVRAVRNGDMAELHAYYLVCPYCGREYAINSNSNIFKKGIDIYALNSRRVPRAIVHEWATMQMSLFDDEMNKELVLSSRIKPPTSFICPECERTSHASDSERQVELTLDEKNITVKCEISEIDELLSLEWIKTNELHISLPIFETVTFDLENGTVSVKVEDALGAVICQRDITSDPELLNGGAVYKVLTSNNIVMRNVKKLFKEAWGTELPYAGKQIDVSALFKMTAFVGYTAAFYVCIPYVQDSYEIESSFCAQARKLHFAADIDEVYRQTLLPKSKSVRKIMFENPGLFFYADEICGIWTALQDHNLLCRFLRGQKVYEILSSLHLRPGMLAYITDYCSVKGAKNVVDEFEDNWKHFRDCAVDYSCMSARMRLQAQEEWTKRKKSNKMSTIDVMPQYSLPMHSPEESIKDCTINGYTFFWLRSSNEYVKAANKLKNCLSEWRTYHPPVVCVRRGNQYVAAIEIKKKHIVQIRGYRNRMIWDDDDLSAAFHSWMQKYDLGWYEEIAFEDDDFEYDVERDYW